MAENGKIYEAISNVMAEIGAIGKNKKNQQQGFMYRGVDDVMNALQPALIKNKIIIVPEVTNEERTEKETEKEYQGQKKLSTLFYERLHITYKFYTTDGSFLEAKVVGEAMDSGDKATNKAMSVAFKYACFQVFCIPTEEMDDPDAECHEVVGKEKSKKHEEKQEAVKPENEEQQMQEQAMQIGSQKITQVKIHTIEKELVRTGVSPALICKRFGVETLADLTEEMFIKAMNGLRKTPTKGA